MSSDGAASGNVFRTGRAGLWLGGLWVMAFATGIVGFAVEFGTLVFESYDWPSSWILFGLSSKLSLPWSFLKLVTMGEAWDFFKFDGGIVFSICYWLVLGALHILFSLKRKAVFFIPLAAIILLSSWYLFDSPGDLLSVV